MQGRDCRIKINGVEISRKIFFRMIAVAAKHLKYSSKYKFIHYSAQMSLQLQKQQQCLKDIFVSPAVNRNGERKKIKKINIYCLSGLHGIWQA